MSFRSEMIGGFNLGSFMSFAVKYFYPLIHKFFRLTNPKQTTKDDTSGILIVNLESIHTTQLTHNLFSTNLNSNSF